MVDNIVKTARKRSEDPVQEALREHKAEWNRDASLLIAQLIAFKRGLNGRGEPRVGIPPSNIKNPLPPEVGRYLEQLATRYEHVVAGAKSIIDEQNQYAQNRRKGKKELEQSGIITSQIDNPELVKYASWWGSRAWTYVKNYGSPSFWMFNDQDIKDRMGLLRVSTDVIEHLHEIENNLVSNSDDAIPAAVYNFLEFTEYFNKLLVPKMKSLVERREALKPEDTTVPKPTEQPKSAEQPKPDETQSKTTSPPGKSDKKDKDKPEEPIFELSGEVPSADVPADAQSDQPQKIDVDIDKTTEIQRELSDVTAFIETVKLLGFSQVIIKDLKNRHRRVAMSAEAVKFQYNRGKHLTDPVESANLQKKYSELLALYKDLTEVGAAILDLDPKQGWSFATLSTKADEKLKTKASEIQDENLRKLASSFLTRWLNRQRLKVFPNSSEQLRLQLVYKILDAIQIIDQYQDLIENKKSSVIHLSETLTKFAAICAGIAIDLYSLALIHNSEYEIERLNTKTLSKRINETYINRLTKASKYFETLIFNQPKQESKSK